MADRPSLVFLELDPQYRLNIWVSRRALLNFDFFFFNLLVMSIVLEYNIPLPYIPFGEPFKYLLPTEQSTKTCKAKAMSNG